MRLDTFLVEKGYYTSRQEAKEAIIAGCVQCDGVVLTKPSKNITEGVSVSFEKKRKYVSRGGEKIESVFLKKYHNIDSIKKILTGALALDVGSSTGGFSDFLLQHGVLSVDAVDVGSAQLHPSLRGKDNLYLYENQDIRTFKTKKEYDVIVADLSFIPLEKILEKVIGFGKKGSLFLLLIKPQFEVGKGNTKKGIVKDVTIVAQVLEKYKDLITQYSITDCEILESGIKGGDGNQEYFLIFNK